MFLGIIQGADNAGEDAGVTLEPERWVEQHGDVLFRHAIARLGDRNAAENVVQETFLAALKGQERFAGRSSERTWLMGILKHKIIDKYRKKSRQVDVEDVEALADGLEQQLFDERGHWAAPPAKWQSAPDAPLETDQLRGVLEACLDKLPPRLAQVFSLREMIELSTEEICNEMTITPTNLGVMMHRARMQLRRCLELGWFAPMEVK